MIYLQKSRPNNNRKLTVSVSITILLVAVIIVLKIFFGGMVEKTSLSIGGPISSGYLFMKNEIVYIGSLFRSRSALVKENHNLRAKIESDRVSVIRFNSLKTEYQNLITEFGRNSFVNQIILGNVISKPPKTPYDVIVSDVGIHDGAVIGSRVYGFGGIPLGRVGEVAEFSSKIILFSSPGETSQVILERTNSTLDIVGLGGGNMKSEVIQDLDVMVGDVILLPEFGGAIIGSVFEIETNVTSAFKTVYFKSEQNILNIRWVEIVKSNALLTL